MVGIVHEPHNTLISINGTAMPHSARAHLSSQCSTHSPHNVCSSAWLCVHWAGPWHITCNSSRAHILHISLRIPTPSISHSKHLFIQCLAKPRQQGSFTRAAPLVPNSQHAVTFVYSFNLSYHLRSRFELPVQHRYRDTAAPTRGPSGASGAARSAQVTVQQKLIVVSVRRLVVLVASHMQLLPPNVDMGSQGGQAVIRPHQICCSPTRACVRWDASTMQLNELATCSLAHRCRT